ncbi:MAG: hypothetical protein AAB740_01560, partial [Patescibacteria group bacterium]
MLINFSKIKKILQKDINWKAGWRYCCEKQITCCGRRGKLPAIKLNKRFLSGFLVVIFILGFLAGGIYGRTI